MKTILVIDDDSDFRFALSNLLQARGWDVIQCGDGEAALSLARQHRPQAILCDLLMPGTNGFRVCANIRGEHALRYSLLIAISGRDFEDTRQTALEAGADEFLPKPVNISRLMELLDRMAGPSPFIPREVDTTRLIRQ
ncbi:MAG TPA: response regulator, partial [Verrucomicrobiae bacterium]|nr:response regulator [Verrucomicrobiae bacterium]